MASLKAFGDTNALTSGALSGTFSRKSMSPRAVEPFTNKFDASTCADLAQLPRSVQLARAAVPLFAQRQPNTIFYLSSTTVILCSLLSCLFFWRSAARKGTGFASRAPQARRMFLQRTFRCSEQTWRECIPTPGPGAIARCSVSWPRHGGSEASWGLASDGWGAGLRAENDQ